MISPQGGYNNSITGMCSIIVTVVTLLSLMRTRRIRNRVEKFSVFFRNAICIF